MNDTAMNDTAMNDTAEHRIKIDHRATQADMLEAKEALLWLIREAQKGNNPAAIAALPDAVAVLARHF